MIYLRSLFCRRPRSPHNSLFLNTLIYLFPWGGGGGSPWHQLQATAQLQLKKNLKNTWGKQRQRHNFKIYNSRRSDRCHVKTQVTTRRAWAQVHFTRNFSFYISVFMNSSPITRQNSHPSCVKSGGAGLLIAKSPDWCVTVGSGTSLIDLVGWEHNYTGSTLTGRFKWSERERERQNCCIIGKKKKRQFHQKLQVSGHLSAASLNSQISEVNDIDHGYSTMF